MGPCALHLVGQGGLTCNSDLSLVYGTQLSDGTPRVRKKRHASDSHPPPQASLIVSHPNMYSADKGTYLPICVALLLAMHSRSASVDDVDTAQQLPHVPCRNGKATHDGHIALLSKLDGRELLTRSDSALASRLMRLSIISGCLTRVPTNLIFCSRVMSANFVRPSSHMRDVALSSCSDVAFATVNVNKNTTSTA